MVIQDGVFSRTGCERIIRYAFETARKEKRSLTSISKANALNYFHGYSGTRFFRNCPQSIQMWRPTPIWWMQPVCLW